MLHRHYHAKNTIELIILAGMDMHSRPGDEDDAAVRKTPSSRWRVGLSWVWEAVAGS
jgi:hypothetical protein